MNFAIRPVAGPDEFAESLRLRERVFCDEQGVDREAEIDGRDPDATHLVGIDEEGVVVATCRLLFDRSGPGKPVICRLGRMAVEGTHRRLGIGRALLETAERVVASCGGREVVLHAQLRVLAFYESAGYVPFGEMFEEAGIEHMRMRKLLGEVRDAVPRGRFVAEGARTE